MTATLLTTKFLSRCISSCIFEGYYRNIDIQLNTVLPDIKLSIKLINTYAVLSVNHLQLPIHPIEPIERIRIDINHVLSHILD
jgi:hypothetical protein